MKRSRISTTVAMSVGVLGAAGFAFASTPHELAELGVTEGSYIYSAGDVPPGASAQVHAVPTGDGRTRVTLHVYGLQPNRVYGAHAHQLGCGADPMAALGHFQHTEGNPTSSDFANPTNEIWLDVTTNAAGNGVADTVVDWQFSPQRRPHSVVIHAMGTLTETPNAGKAGARVACLTVDF
jgi:Cu-Zn family superoxide dismutase